jgi:hypothetical protein
MSAINWSNVTGLEQIPALASTASNYMFWSGTLYMIWVIVLLFLLAWGWETALVVSAFVGLILSLPMAYGDLISFAPTTFFASVLLLMFLYIIYTSNKTR